MIGIITNNWIFIWIIIEINIICFIILLIKKLNMAIKYFIIQSITSTILLILLLEEININLLTTTTINECLFLIICLKARLPPMHIWLIQVISIKIPIQIILILTTQKLLPINLMSYNITPSIILVIILSSIIGGFGGILQNSIIKIIAYSSFAHGGWILCNLIINIKTWIIYFMVYRINLWLLLVLCSTQSLNKLSNTNEFRHINKVNFTTIILSLGGIPPLIGFITKIITIIYLIETEITLTLAYLIIGTVITLYFYFKICYTPLIEGILYKKRLWNLNNYNLSINIIIIILTPRITIILLIK